MMMMMMMMMMAVTETTKSACGLRGATLSTTDLAWIGVGLYPDLRVVKPAANLPFIGWVQLS
jgi:hypothetical protein